MFFTLLNWLIWLVVVAIVLVVGVWILTLPLMLLGAITGGNANTKAYYAKEEAKTKQPKASEDYLTANPKDRFLWVRSFYKDDRWELRRWPRRRHRV